MLNLKERNPATIQIPDEQDATLFLNEDGNVALKKQNGDVSEIGSGGGASYLVYTALLSQTGTNAPVATVLENTLGNVSYSFYSDGAYGVSKPFSLQSKTYIDFKVEDGGGGSTLYHHTSSASQSGTPDPNNSIGLMVNRISTDSGSFGESLRANNWFGRLEIRVYP